MSIEAKLRRAGKGKHLIIENGAEGEVNAGLVAMIGEAFAIRNQLLSGSDDSIEAMTQRLGLGKGHLTSLVRLSLLAPDIVRALLEGHSQSSDRPSRSSSFVLAETRSDRQRLIERSDFGARRCQAAIINSCCSTTTTILAQLSIEPDPGAGAVHIITLTNKWGSACDNSSGQAIRPPLFFQRADSIPLRTDQPSTTSIEWLTYNGSCYLAAETRRFARIIGLMPLMTPVESPQSNGMAEIFASGNSETRT